MQVILPTLKFIPTSLPPAIVGLPYNQEIIVSGSPSNEYVKKEVIGNLPPSFTVDFSQLGIGKIFVKSDNPTTEGNFDFFILIKDDAGNYGLGKY